MREIVLAMVANCLVFTGVGLGPMAALAPRVGLLAVLAMAPAVGYALYSVALTWWLLQEGSAGSAAWPLAGVLLAVSAACLALAWKSVRARLPVVSRRRAVAGLLGLAMCLGLLIAPLAAGNKGYAVFRGNASDSFIYMFLARYFDEYPRSWAFERTEEQVTAAAPMLGPARNMLNMRWTSGAMLTAGSRLGGMGILDFQYPFTLVSYLLFFAALLPFLTAMGLSAPAAALSALALSTGFYAQLVLDIRAFSQINTLPLAILLIYVLSLPTPQRRSGALRRTALLGFCYLTTFVNYTEIFPMIFGAAASYLTLKAALSRLTRRELAIQSAGFALGMAATWPVRFLWEHMLAQIHFTETAPQLWSEAYFTWLFHNVPAGIFGLPLLENGFSRLPGWGFLDWPGWLVTVFACLVCAFFLLGGLRAMADRKRDAPLVALAFAAASLAAFALFCYKDKPWVAGKGLSYFYPCVTAVFLYAALARPMARPLANRAVGLCGLTLATLFLASQFTVAGLRPAYAAKDLDYPRYVRNHGRYRTIDCELAPIRAALRRAKAENVAICSADPWKWAFLGLALDGPVHVDSPARLATLPADTPVFVALDRPIAGAPAELAPFLAGENATFALYRLPAGRLAALLPSLACETNP
ncbi:hypothetical protein [Desulfovibrio sp. TomC]|uniref:hypothetical protein n=1 Tax=Desulfovibrio sp. TomC TaxID=1562888 RepID=UPI0005744A53|nr:hypothetical protein [Desulfovibrio sp. TomC]KHK00641.1 hypothetical protein NY78_3904 [Desulfovibrio sp. TomC]